MRILINELRTDSAGFMMGRPVAEWTLPDGVGEPMEVSFTQLATPSTTKVCTYRIQILASDKRVSNALMKAANVDGAAHKQWIIDQMIRVLTGQNYDEWVALYENNGEYFWDTGVAP